MYRKRWNRLLVLGVCIAFLLISSLYGCTQRSKTSKESDNSTGLKEEQAEGFELPIVQEPVTLTFMARENQTAAAPGYGSGKLPVWNEVEKLTNVKINWQTVPSSDYNTAVQTRLAANVDLPDMICVPDPLPYLRQNMFVPMDELIKKYAPDVKKMLDENPDVRGSVTAYDGKIYCITQVPKEINKVHTRMLFIREDWLKRLGLEVPKTMDDWYNVLKAFKENDANGNGDKNDEIPMVNPSKTEIGTRAFAAAYGLEYAYTDGYSVNENGKVEFDWIKPAAKEYMAFMQKLIGEGLFVRVDNNERDMRLANDTAGSVEVFPDAIAGRNKLLTKTVPNGKFVGTVPPSYKQNKPFYITPPPSYGYETGIFITKQSKYPEIAMKWINFLFSEQGYLLTNFGIEDMSYKMKDGKPQVTEYFTNNPDGLSYGEAQRFLGARPSFANFMSQDFEIQVKKTDPIIAPTVDIIKQFNRPPSFPMVMASADEIEVLKTVGTDLNTYVAENCDKFMLGQRPLAEFDNFVKEVKGMGLDDVLKIKQKQYDRYIESIKK